MHYPVDHCPADFTVMAIPRLRLWIDHHRTMTALVLRDRTAASDKVLTGSSLVRGRDCERSLQSDLQR